MRAGVFALGVGAAADGDAVFTGQAGGGPAGEASTAADLDQRQALVEVVTGEQVTGQQFAGGSSGQVMDGRWSRAVEQQRANREAAYSEVFAGGFDASELGAHKPVQVWNVDLVDVGPWQVEPVEKGSAAVPGHWFVTEAVAGQEVRRARVQGVGEGPV